MTWTIKILTGRHSGAKFNIEGLHTTLGSCSKSSDCVVTDTDVADNAIMITTTENYIIVKELNNEKWYINGKIKKSRIVNLMPFDVVQIGPISFTIGPKDKNWPPISLISKSRFNISWSGLIVSGLLSMGTLNASLYFSNTTTSVGIKEEKQFIQTSYSNKEATNTFDLDVLQEGNYLVVTGYIEDLPSAYLAQNHIKKTSSLPLIWKVYRLDKLKSSIITFLNEHNLKKYLVDVDKDGTIYIKGVVSNQSVISELIPLMKKDIPGINKIVIDTISIDKLVTWLNNKIKETGVINVSASYNNKNILISGKTTENKIQHVLKIIEDAYQKFGTQISITYQPFIDPEGLIPSFQVISTSHTPYVELTNGQKYLENSVIGDGFIINTITDDGISLSKNGQKLWIAPGG
ncbi:FHA domain-containing protein [Vibrio sp. TBV020]|uniref:FHA domain-containing protein n=1 Tax=Vibrio sp. TBV020 TaxID=3137398 RepID=UPI0038CDAB91